MNRRRTSLILVLVACFSLAAAPGALAHGEQGQRLLFTYDVQPATAPVDIYALSDEYRGQLLAMGEKGQNDCISVSYLPARFSWEKERPVFNPPAAGDGVGMADYLVTGTLLEGKTGEPTVSLSLVTSRSRTVVARGEAHIFYEDGKSRADAELWGGRMAAMNLAGNEGGTEHLADKILKFERKVREEKPQTAIGPRLQLEGFQETMKPGASQEITVKLEDCDGYKLKGRKVQVSADQGQVSPGEVTIGEDGTAAVTYTAPAKKAEVTLSASFGYQRPSERELTERAGAWIDVKDEKPEDPAVFHVSLEVNRIVEGNFQSTPGTPALFAQSYSLSESLDPLRLEFDVNQRLEPVKESVKADYVWKADRTHQSAPGQGGSQGDQHGTELVDWEVTLQRHLNPVKSEPKLEVVDLDELGKAFASLLGGKTTTQPEDTLRLTYRVTLHGMTKGSYTVAGQTVDLGGDELPGFSDDVTFKYQYKQADNEETLQLPLYSAGSLVQFKQNRVKYQMTLKDVKFAYLPGEGTSVKVGGEDYTDRFKYVVFWREWRAGFNHLMLGLPRLGPYRLTQGWTEGADDLNGEMLDALKWIVDIGSVPKSQWPVVRVLREYLVAVEGFPELGFMYAAVTAETDPVGKYWVRKYQPEKIAAGDWEKIKQSQSPYRDEESGGNPVRSFKN